MDTKLTIHDLQRIANLLESKAGITMVIMPNEFAKRGVSILLMHPDDIEQINQILKPAK